LELLKTDIIGLIQYLLPGFLAAWVYYGLTAHQKSSPFERVVEALIFTAVGQVCVSVIRQLCLALGAFVKLGVWTSEVSFGWSIGVALLLGIGFAFLANCDLHTAFLRRRGVTKRTSYPSEWYSAFHRTQEPMFVVLQIEKVDDEPRNWIYGEVEEWPDRPDDGHFVLVKAEWLDEENNRTKLDTVDRILIPSKSVEIVEFVSSVHRK
jgi:hypothetical protein